MSDIGIVRRQRENEKKTKRSFFFLFFFFSGRSFSESRNSSTNERPTNTSRVDKHLFEIFVVSLEMESTMTSRKRRLIDALDQRTAGSIPALEHPQKRGTRSAGFGVPLEARKGKGRA